jgi:hypothetical protein
MSESTPPIVSVSRRIAATPSAIFAVLADPRRHIELDGSDMIRGTDHPTVISDVGDVFLMNMHNGEMGDYVMRNTVVEFESDARIAWAPARHDIEEEDWDHRWRFLLAPDGTGATIVTEEFDLSRSPEDARRILRNGERWRDDMGRTLERLDALMTSMR